ncbi:hypothetical protein [uncultured Mucilaginibacter sp.]|uniref:hypothetical protein n=1 Tax=uncultured Mucilaginibacter sp. TaxID=797541 RepID=UPI00261E88B6|nr:hypothetical protein [uncultured Mucilaginibacter sp.]
MKKLFFLLWLLPAACIAQTDSTQVKPHNVYCRISISTGFLSSKISVKLDSGRDSSKGSLTDAEAAKLSRQLSAIDNEIDAINYMALQGWEVVTYRPETYHGSSTDNPTYLLVKKVTP